MLWKSIIESNVYTISIASALRIFNGKDKARAIIVTLMTILNSAMEVLGLAMIIPVIYLINDPAPIYNNKLLNRLYLSTGMEQERYFVLTLIVGMALVFLLKNVFSIYVYYLQNAFAFRTASNLVERQAANFLKLDYLKLKESGSNYIVRDIATIPKEFASSILIPCLKITNELLVLILIVSGLVLYNWHVFFLLGLTMLPLIYFILVATKSKSDSLGTERNQLMPLAYQHAFEIVFSYIDVKLNRRESFFVKKLTGRFEELFGKDLLLFTLQRIPHRVMEFSIILMIAILYTLVVVLMRRPSAEIVWILILFATAAYRVMPSLNEIMGSLILIRSGQYIFGILKTEDVDFNHTQIDFVFRDNIEWKSINYGYPKGDRLALNDVSLTISQGSTIGIMGVSGSGKTTLGKLMLRLIKEQAGTFTVDGQAVADLSSWQSILGYVQQDFHILDGTLAENIAFGIDTDEIDIPKLERVIEQAKLTTFVQRLRDGYHHDVGEFGANISGGERQRIAIARALYGNAQLLVLDEATNALDEHLEQDIMDMIHALPKDNLTVIVISNRIAAFRHCDAVYELEAGRIIGKHRYVEIMNKEAY